MNFAPAVEVREQDNNLIVSADLPGIDKNDIKVEYTPEGLVIEGDRKHETEEHHGGVHRSERSYGHFYRLIPLPEGANADKARAQFKDGVLEIKMPLAETRKAKQIPINA
jgi:HSP20 family protein